MTHWLLEIAREEFPKKAAWERVSMPADLADQWGLIASLAGLRPDQIVATVARHYKMDVAPLDVPPKEVARIIPEKTAKQFCIVPLSAAGDTLTVAVADPTDAEAVAQLRFVSGRKIVRCLASPDDIDTLSTALYAQAGADETIGAIRLLNLDHLGTEEFQPQEAPIVNLGRELIRRAIEKRASDVHLHPFAGGGVVRFRVDGTLQRIVTLPRATLDSLTRFFKSTARWDPTDHRVPKQGRSF